ncbi:VOC family protein [Candidatus Woesearchaeota archaeon]|nr:VOC family protein [Candidatus Woesearchaeota archaeon]
MAKQIFVNLPVKDLNKTIEFFTKLSFEFNPKFTDENATCMIIGENIYAMLLVEKFFKTFTADKEISDAKRSTEVLNAFTVDSREEVDNMIDKAIEAGGKEFRKAQDHGWMYGRAFEDLDGHIWEIFYMDESQMPQKMKNNGGK